jgi:polyisoprenoid-binding protein YceI
MKIFASRGHAPLLALLVFFALPALAHAQKHYAIDTNSIIHLNGTSTVRNWMMIAHDFTGNATFTFDDDNELQSVSQFSIRLPVHNLKSESHATEKGAYKALKDDKFKYITFELHTAGFKESGKNHYLLALHGDLTIAGVSRPTTLMLYAAVDADGSILCSGSLGVSLADFEIVRPSMLLGTMKIGDELSFSYHLRLCP